MVKCYQQFSNLISLCESSVQDKADLPLYSFLDNKGDVYETMSFGRLYTRARAVAAILQDNGLQRAPVLLLYPHDVCFIEAFFGSVFAGAFPMPVSKPRGSDWDALVNLISASQSKTVLTTKQMAERLPNALVASARLTVLLTDEIESSAAAFWIRPDINDNTVAFVQYTSGSTSNPKGIVVTHANVMHNAAVVKSRLFLTPGDVGISWLPFFHDMGLINHIIQPLFSRIHNYHLSPLSFVTHPARWLAAISRYRGSISGGPNFAFELCTKKVADEATYDLSSWRVAYCGSDRISVGTLSAFGDKFSVAGFQKSAFFPCYGLAESTLFVCGTNEVDDETCQGGNCRYTRVGDLVDSQSIALVDPQTGRSIDSEKAIGEIWVKSLSVAPGYYNPLQRKVDAFGNTCSLGCGYLRTGDLGFFYRSGLYFVGRQKNLMKIRGRSFFAEDIESYIEGLGVSRSAVFSIDHQGSEALVIVVEVTEYSDQDERSPVIGIVRAAVCDAFGITPYAIRAASKGTIPLTSSGKLKRSIVRDEFSRGLYG